VALGKDGEDLCTDNVRNEKVLRTVKEDRNILKTIKKEEGCLGWSHLVYELPSKMLKKKRKDRGKDGTGRRGRRRKQLLDRILETQRRSTRSHSVENSLWKRLWICRETDYGMNKINNYR